MRAYVKASTKVYIIIALIRKKVNTVTEVKGFIGCL
jgi:hypothetical protein